jgi:hypothetical protein
LFDLQHLGGFGDARLDLVGLLSRAMRRPKAMFS